MDLVADGFVARYFGIEEFVRAWIFETTIRAWTGVLGFEPCLAQHMRERKVCILAVVVDT